jgi:TatD DNase family protein
MPNLDHTSIDRMLETEEKNPSVCLPMMGLHPCYVKKGFERELYLVEAWLDRKKFSAIGEVGIDLHWDLTFRNEQEEALRIQIELAAKKRLPLVIHCRNSMKETIALIKNSGKEVKGIFHCFSGTAAEAKEVIEMGFLLGIGGVATFKNAGLDKIIPDLELKNLVLETDSPYLTPAPFRKHRNDPSYIPLIAEKIAQLKNIDIAEVAMATSANASGLFRL